MCSIFVEQCVKIGKKYVWREYNLVQGCEICITDLGKTSAVIFITSIPLEPDQYIGRLLLSANDANILMPI